MDWCLADSRTFIFAQLFPYKSVPIFVLYMERIVKKDLGKVLDEWWVGQVVMPNGESLIELQDRAWESLEEIIKEDKNVIVVSHNFTIMTLLCKIQKMDLKDFRSLRIDIAPKTVIEFVNNEAVIRLYNDVSHLCEMNMVWKKDRIIKMGGCDRWLSPAVNFIKKNNWL